MAIVLRIDVMLAERKMKAKDLAEEMGLTEAQLSKIRNGHMKGIKFDTLDRLCELLDCEPGDLIRRAKLDK
ncbi:MAG: helix-turn-helix transcriptional regulator [Hyphomonadaceae bacterium]